jgi:hypothetical protein
MHPVRTHKQDRAITRVWSQKILQRNRYCTFTARSQILFYTGCSTNRIQNFGWLFIGLLWVKNILLTWVKISSVTQLSNNLLPLPYCPCVPHHPFRSLVTIFKLTFVNCHGSESTVSNFQLRIQNHDNQPFLTGNFLDPAEHSHQCWDSWHAHAMSHPPGGR